MRKIFLTFCAMIAAALMATGCGNTNHTEQQEKDKPVGEKNTDIPENQNGTAYTISIENAFYYDLMTTDEGGLFALTDNTHESASGTSHVIAWQSSDQGNTWKELLYQPESLNDESDLLAGALRNRTEGVEAFAIFAEHQDEQAGEQACHLYRITENTCDELNAGGVFEQLGDTAWNISPVNDHVISIAGEEQCILYDTEKQKAVKSLSYDPYTIGFLSMPNQFLVYGKEISYCLNAETLEEQTAEKSLQEFISAMYEKNDSTVLPPMKAYKNSIICAVTEAVYEYTEGKTVQTLSIPATVNGGYCFNGILPICKSEGRTYYISSMGMGTTSLQRLEADKGTEKDTLTVYSLVKNEDISQIAVLFQQAHPELKVDLLVGMTDEASLTRTDAIKQLNTELLAGEGPDILIVDGLSVEKYTDTGLLPAIKALNTQKS